VRFVEVESASTPTESEARRVRRAAPRRAANATHARRERIVHKWHSDAPGKSTFAFPRVCRLLDAHLEHSRGARWFPLPHYPLLLSPSSCTTRSLRK